MAFQELEVVRVVASVPHGRADRSLEAAQHPQPGDVGAVVMVHRVSAGEEPAYTVECVDPTGHTRWLADLLESELESFQPGGRGAA